VNFQVFICKRKNRLEKGARKTPPPPNPCRINTGFLLDLRVLLRHDTQRPIDHSRSAWSGKKSQELPAIFRRYLLSQAENVNKYKDGPKQARVVLAAHAYAPLLFVNEAWIDSDGVDMDG
jgi:hypothetical protein